jgi:hypothetical protein
MPTLTKIGRGRALDLESVAPTGRLRYVKGVAHGILVESKEIKYLGLN